MDTIRGCVAEDVTTIFGTTYDESMGDQLRITFVATGLDTDRARPQLGATVER